MKYSLNLDEDLLAKFFKIIKDDAQVIHAIDTSVESQEVSEEMTTKALQSIFLQSLDAFKKYIDDYMSEDATELESKY